MYPVYVAPPKEEYIYKGEKPGQNVLPHYNALVNLSESRVVKKVDDHHFRTRNGTNITAFDVFAISFGATVWLFETEEERNAEYTRVSNIVLAVVPAVLKPIVEARNL